MQTTTHKVKQIINESIQELQQEKHDAILASACIVALRVLSARLNFLDLEKEEIDNFKKFYHRGKYDYITKLPVNFNDALNHILK
jgi:hypothetical protein